MDNANVKINTDKKKDRKKVMLAVFISLAVLSVILCIFLMYIGLLQYPGWYLKANFRANKQYFETIINIDECDGFTSGQEYYIDEINSSEMKSAIQEICVDGIWSFYKVYLHDEEDEYVYGDNYDSNDDEADEKQREVAICIFRPNNTSDYDVREIIYAKDEDSLNSIFSNVNNLYHIEDNWYYFQHYDNNPWDKVG